MAIIELLEKGFPDVESIPESSKLSTPSEDALYIQALSNYNESSNGGESKASDESESFKIEIDKIMVERKLNQVVYLKEKVLK